MGWGEALSRSKYGSTDTRALITESECKALYRTWREYRISGVQVFARQFSSGATIIRHFPNVGEIHVGQHDVLVCDHGDIAVVPQKVFRMWAVPA